MGARTVGDMAESDGALLLKLPVTYAVVLALRDAGLATDEIARRLDLSADSMPMLIEIAEAKLSTLRCE